MTEEVEVGSLAAAMVLLDAWAGHAHRLEAENAQLRCKYAMAHERCEQLRELVAGLPDPGPLVPDCIATEQADDPFA